MMSTRNEWMVQRLARLGSVKMVRASRAAMVLLICLPGCDGSSSSNEDRANEGGVSSFSLVVADFNNDGRMDIVTAKTQRGDASSAGAVEVILQDGVTFGEFEEGVVYEMGANTVDAAVGDVNADGKLDVLSSSRSQSGLSWRLQSPLGTGEFGKEANLATAARPGALVVADIDGNAFDDIVVSGTSIVTWLCQPADPDVPCDEEAGFVAGDTLNVSGQTLAVADLNGDGRLDIVAGSSSTEISVLLQYAAPVPPGSFLPPERYEVGLQPYDIAVGDLDRDGRPDIAVVNRGDDSEPSTASVAVLLQQIAPLNAGAFRAGEQYQIGGKGTQIVIADINGDGLADIAATNELASGGGVSVLLQEDPGTGVFAPEFRVRARSPWGLGAADFNRDNLMDFAITNGDGVAILFQNARSPGEFLAPESIGGDGSAGGDGE